MSAQGFVSIVVPTLNEEAYIERVISSLLPEGDCETELLVVDGGSSDGTRDIVREMATMDRRIRLLENPKRFQSAAMNVAAREADPRSDILVRCDAHCSYPAGYVRLIERVLRETGAQSVVVPMLTTGSDTCFQKAVAAAQNSRLGNGGAAHRTGAKPSGWIDHGHHAGFVRSFFVSIDGYDESFSVNEDGEYDVRVLKAGGRIWMETSAMIEYHPRKTPLALLKQYFSYGKGRARTTIKHSARPKMRQMFPVAVFAAVAGGAALSPVFPLAAAAPLLYLVAALAFGAGEAALRRTGRCALASGLAMAIMHVSWGLGFLIEVARSASARRQA